VRRPALAAGTHALSRAIVARRSSIAMGWLVLAGALLPWAMHSEERLAAGGSRVTNSESQTVQLMLASRFSSPYATSAVLVVDGIPVPNQSEGRSALGEIVTAVSRTPGVSRTVSYLSTGDNSFLARSASFVVVGIAAGAPAGDRLTALRRTTAAIERRLRVRYPRAQLAWTGDVAFDVDVRTASGSAAAAAERRAVPLTLVLLIVVFGGVVAAGLPIVIGTLAIVISLGAAALINSHWPLAVILRNIVSMLGLGVGIDYGLFMVSRFREERAAGLDARAAAVETIAHAGHTVLLSGASVGIGFAALLAVPASELRSIAVGGLLVITASVLLATTLLPGLLVWSARWLDMRPMRPRLTDGGCSTRWRNWGRWVASRPLSVLLVAGTPIVALAWQARRLSNDLPSVDWLPAQMESTRGIRVLEAGGKTGVAQTMRVLLELPAGASVLDSTGWRAIQRLSRTLSHDVRVATVRSLPDITRAQRPSAALIALLPWDLRASYVSRDERLGIVELVPRDGVSPGALVRFVRDIRQRNGASLTGLRGARVLVGGLPAFNADYQDAIGGSVLSVAAVVIVGTFLALFVGFRSVLVPLKAVALNLLSVCAAFGAAVLVFQDGYGARALGLTGPIDGLFPAVPILVFCLVFGLSMDYEVFLVSRVAEATRAGMSTRDALAEGMARTGGVITNAALVMIVVFTSFATGEFLLIKILGFTLAVAVLVDATVVRLAIGPALLRLAGQHNWWPDRMP
jgi:putative drug exporter of the RND superfamily